MTLSAYELERQRNIERNQEVLRSLGLVGDGKLIPDPPPKPKPQRVSVKADACVELPSRRSDRVKHKPAMFDGLTDDFFGAEHCDSGVAYTFFKPDQKRRPSSSCSTLAQEVSSQSGERSADQSAFFSE